MIIPLPYVTLVEYKSLRSEPSIRITIDLGEVSGKVIEKIHEMRTQGGGSLILADPHDFVKTIHVLCDSQNSPFPESIMKKLEPAEIVYLQQLTGEAIEAAESTEEVEDAEPAELAG